MKKEMIVRKSDLLRDAKEARRIYAMHPNDVVTDEGEWEEIIAEIKKFDERMDLNALEAYWKSKMDSSSNEWVKNTYQVMLKVTKDTLHIPKDGYLPGFGMRG